MPADESRRMCPDPDTREITIAIPCALAERIAAYANESGASLSGVVVEALDFFLRERQRRPEGPRG